MSRRRATEVEYLHKKLVPMNVLICIVAFIAGICMLLMPWVDVRMKVSGEKISALVHEKVDENMIEGEEEVERIVYGALEIIEKNGLPVQLRIAPLEMLSAVIGEEKEMLAYILSTVYGAIPFELVEEWMASVYLPVIMEEVVFEEIGKALSGKNGGAEEYKQSVTQVVRTLVGTEQSPSDPERAKKDFSSLLDKIEAEQAGGEEGITIPKEELNAYFSDMISTGTNPETGKFELYYYLEVLLAEELPEDQDGTQSSRLENRQRELQLFQALFEDASKLIEEEFEEITSEKIMLCRGIFFAVFLLVAGIPALCWFILGVSALCRIFTQRKTLRTWYVKLFCIWSGLGVLLGYALVKVAPFVYRGKFAGIFDLLSIRVFGSGVVAGICLLVLLSCEWFYGNPIKKRIKRAQNKRYVSAYRR